MKRKIYFDVLRVYASFAVVLLHVASVIIWGSNEYASFDWQVCNVYHSITRWCVPVFIMISGALFLNPEKPISAKKIISKNIVRIAGALFLFGLLIYFTLCLPFGRENILKDLEESFFKYNLWFLYMLIGLYLLVPLLRIVIKYASKRLLEYFLLLLIAFCFIAPDYINLHSHTFVAKLAANILFPLSAGGYLFYFLLGYYLDKYELRFKWLIYILGAASLVIITIKTSLLCIEMNSLQPRYLEYVSVLCLCASVAVFTLVKSLKGKSEKANSLTFLLSKYSLGIYGLHPIFIELFARKASIVPSMFNPILATPLIALLVFVLSLLFAFLLSKIPFIKRFIL